MGRLISQTRSECATARPNFGFKPAQQSYLTFVLVENHLEKAIQTQSLRATIVLYHLYRPLHMFPGHGHIAKRELHGETRR